MQLLWTAGRDAERTGAGIDNGVLARTAKAACEAGFDEFPGPMVNERGRAKLF
jgi:hypothetical protein